MKTTILILISLLLLNLNLACTPKEKTDVASNAPTDGPGDGGGGDDEDDGGPSVITEQGNFRIIFVTNTEVNGTGVVSGMGSGIASFDALCESEKASHGLGGTFKALVASTNRRPGGTDWVLRAGKEYRRSDLTTVIDVAETEPGVGVIFPFVANPLVNTITSSLSAKYPWTGFKNDWTVDSYTCTNWTRNDFDNTADTLGTYGKSSIQEELVDFGYTQFWGGPLLFNGDIAGEQLRCNTLHPVYCVQTKQLPPPGLKKKLFLSTTTVSGSGGFAAFDAACAADAITKGLTGTYKAVVGYTTPNTSGNPQPVRRVCQAGDCIGATGTEQSLDWPLLPNTHYIRDDGVTWVGTTNEHAYFEGTLEEPIGSGQYWSGMTNALVVGGAHQHCNGWSDPAMNGFINEAGTGAADYGSSTVACTNSLSVLCAEQ